MDNVKWVEGKEGKDGFDYDKQSWILDSKYVRCGHPEEMDCQCYGKLHNGEDFRGEFGSESDYNRR